MRRRVRTAWPRAVTPMTNRAISALIGRQFGALRVESYSHTTAHRMTVWNARCDCGQWITVRGDMLRSGVKSSCGCIGRRSLDVPTSSVSAHPEYNAWRKMILRCHDVRDKSYAAYGGRGIKVCARWENSLAAFLEDMGPRPSSKHELDRINNDGDYTPKNCRWVTRHVQSRNTRRNRYVEWRGETLLVCDLAARVGIQRKILQSRLHHGWTVERAATEPVIRRALR